MSGQTAAAAVAAIVSLICTGVVLARLAQRPARRAPLIAWAIGFALFSVATICLWEGAWRGWDPFGFRLYYLTGGILVVAYALAGRVDIGGRSLYLECRGSGSPTVVLVAGYRASGRYWTDDLLQPDAPQTMVLPGVAGFTRVCTYDRPGALATAPVIDDDVGDPSLSEAEATAGVKILPSRSDPVPQPRTPTDCFAFSAPW